MKVAANRIQVATEMDHEIVRSMAGDFDSFVADSESLLSERIWRPASATLHNSQVGDRAIPTRIQ